MDQVIEFVSNHWMLSAAWVALFSLLIFTLSKTSSKVIGNQEVTTLINREKATVVDIRSKADFGNGHLLGAINIPAAEIKNAEDKLEKFKQTPIILVDANGMQAAASAQFLQKKGFSQVSRLQGGIASWINDNLPLNKT